MSKTQFRILAAGIGAVILLLLWLVLTPVGWLWAGLAVLCAFTWWLSGVMVDAVGKAWRQR